MIHLNIFRSSGVFSREVLWVNIPGEKGRRGVLPEAAPEILLLAPGEVAFQTSHTTPPESYPVGEGAAHLYTNQDGMTALDLLVFETPSDEYSGAA